MSRLDRYLGRQIASSTLLVLLVLVGLFTFVEFADRLRDLGKGAFTFNDLVRYLLLSLPNEAYQLLPMSVLLGTTVALSALAIDSELVALRAAGVSVVRVVGAAMKTGAVFVLAAVIIGEFIAPTTEKLAQRERSESTHVGIQQEQVGVWLRDGPRFINIGEVLPDLSVLRVNIYEFDAQQRLRQQVFAESGRYHNGVWRLKDVSESRLQDHAVEIRHDPELDWPSSIDPEMLSVFTVDPESLSAFNLYRYIDHLRRNNQDTRRYELAFWSKIMAPLSTAVMVILAIPFVFAQPRSAGMGVRLFLGIMLGIGFFVLNRGLGYASLLIHIPVVIGAIAPTLVFLAASLFLIRRVS